MLMSWDETRLASTSSLQRRDLRLAKSVQFIKSSGELTDYRSSNQTIVDFSKSSLLIKTHFKIGQQNGASICCITCQAVMRVTPREVQIVVQVVCVLIPHLCKGSNLRISLCFTLKSLITLNQKSNWASPAGNSSEVYSSTPQIRAI